MTNKEFEKMVIDSIKIDYKQNINKITMTEFLNKHATNNNTILGYWFGNDLNGLSDIEILQKCIWLDITKCSILETLFGFEKFEEFCEDYIAVVYNLGYEIKDGAIWKKLN